MIAYREEPGVSPTSTTETYAALRLHLKSWRWSGVPFLLRTGKRLPTRDTRVVITFHDVPLHLFKTAGVHTLHRNRWSFASSRTRASRFRLSPSNRDRRSPLSRSI